MKKTAIAFVLAALGLLAVYRPALSGGFVWDDVMHLRDTPAVQAPGGLSRIWFSTECRDYYPLSYSVFWLEWHLFGGWTTGYHLVNVLLHAAGVVALWRLLQRLNVRYAWLGALLFAVHPVNVPSVAWISELKNVLAFLLAALAVLAFVSDRQGLALVSFLASLLAKPAAVGVPVVLLALLWWRNGRLERRDWIRVLPFLAVAVVMGVVTIWFQHHRALEEQSVLSTGILERVALAGAVVWFYLLKAIVPVSLHTIYSGWPAQWNWSATAALALLAGLLWWQRGRWGRGWLAALVCYVMLLFPVLGFFEQGYYRFSPVADHWQYFALPVVCAMLGAIHWPAVIVVAWLAWSTWTRSHAYASDEQFWKQALTDNRQTWIAQYCYANHLARQHDPAAMTHYTIALQLNPAFAPAHYNLAILLAQQRRFAEATGHMTEACRLEPQHPDWRHKLDDLQRELEISGGG